MYKNIDNFARWIDLLDYINGNVFHEIESIGLDLAIENESFKMSHFARN